MNRRTIFFDLGNVLVYVDKTVAVRKLAEITGTDLPDILEYMSSETEQKFERGLLTSDEYLSIFKGKFNLPESLTLEEMTKLWILPFRPNEPVLALLPILKRQANLFLLSNTNAIHIAAVESEFHIIEQLDGAILSFEVGYRKPEREIYEIALEKASAKRENSLFIDDSEENVAGAKEAGIRALQYQSKIKLEEFFISEGFQLYHSYPREMNWIDSPRWIEVEKYIA